MVCCSRCASNLNTLFYLLTALQAQLWHSDNPERHRIPELNKVLSQFASISIQVRETVHDLDLPSPAVEADGTKDDLKASTIRTLEVVIGTLRDCLPSIVSFSRACIGLDNDILVSEYVTKHLETAVELIRLCSEALSQAAAAVGHQPYKGVGVYKGPNPREFDRQASFLEQWAEKYKRETETKLARGNPAKLAAVVGAVCNISYFLGK